MRSQFWALAGSIAIAISFVNPANAQFRFLPYLQFPNYASSKADNNKIVAGWVQLDGRRLFQIAASRDKLLDRLQEIQQNLDRISQDYFQQTSPELNIQSRNISNLESNKNLPVIYVNNKYLLTITDRDASLQQEDPSKVAADIQPLLQQHLVRGWQERQSQFLFRQAKITAGIVLVEILASAGAYLWYQRSKRQTPQPV